MEEYMRVKLEDLPNGLRKQAMDQLHAPVCSKKQKRGGRVALDEAPEVPKLNPPVRLTVSVWKTGGNWDTSNIEQKAILDGLVHSGVIKDDTIKEAPEILLRGYRCDKKTEERTEVEVIEL